MTNMTPIEDGSTHHYFASTVFGWKTANTREEAINGLVKGFRSELTPMVKNSQKRGDIGVYVWTCKVPLPNDADHPYRIEFYAPKDVGATEGQHHYVTYLTGKQMAYNSFADEAPEYSTHRAC